MDLSSEQACFDLYHQVKDQNIDVLINNAGYGCTVGFPIRI